MRRSTASASASAASALPSPKSNLPSLFLAADVEGAPVEARSRRVRVERERPIARLAQGTSGAAGELRVRLGVVEHRDVVMREELGEIIWPAQRLEPVRDPTVLFSTLRPRNLLVRDLTDERVPERVFRLAGDGAPALALDELASLEAMERCFRRVPLLPQPTDPEHATENGGVLQQLLLLAVEHVEAGGDDALDGLGERGAVRALVEQADELLRVQRVAAGPLEERRLDVGRNRGLIEKRVHELRGLHCPRAAQARASARSSCHLPRRGGA